MNVCFVNATHTWGGVKTWTLALGAFLAARGHRVDVACRRGDPLETACPPRGLVCHPFRYGMDFSPGAIRRFVALFDRCGTDLVITNVSKELRTGGVAARLRRLAHVNRLGSEFDIEPSWRQRVLYATLVDRVFVPSQHVRRHLDPRVIEASKVRVFHNAVDQAPFRPHQPGDVRLAILAKLDRRKRIDRVVEALAPLRALPWWLDVGGAGAERGALEALVGRLGLAERVHFAGHVEPGAFLARAHVGVLFSRRDPFPNAVLEYMAASCAVVASRVDGIPEMITDGVDGLLVDPEDTDGLRTALTRVIVDASLREALARRAHQTVMGRFARSRVFAAVEHELETIVNERRATVRTRRPAVPLSRS